MSDDELVKISQNRRNPGSMKSSVKSLKASKGTKADKCSAESDRVHVHTGEWTVLILGQNQNVSTT